MIRLHFSHVTFSNSLSSNGCVSVCKRRHVSARFFKSVCSAACSRRVNKFIWVPYIALDFPVFGIASQMGDGSQEDDEIEESDCETQEAVRAL